MRTKEALLTIQVQIERSRDVNCDVFACLIDFEKAFDNVQPQKLIEVSGLDDKDIRLLINLYAELKATIRLENEPIPEFYVRREVPLEET